MPKFRVDQYLKFLLAALLYLGALDGSFATPPLSVYGNLPGFERAAISPSGNRVAMIGVVAETRRLIVVDQDDKPLLVRNIGDAKARNLLWAGDNLVLIEISSTQPLGVGFTTAKAELSSMIVLPLTGEKEWTVFDNNHQIIGGIRGFHGLVERNGSWFGYFGGSTLESDGKTEPYLQSMRPVLYEVDLQTKRARKIAARTDGQENYRNWLIGADGKVSATFDYLSDSGKWTIRNGKGDRIAAGTNKLGAVDMVGFGAVPDTLIYSDQNTDDGEQHWFQIPLSGGEPKEILGDTYIKESHFDKLNRQFLGYEIEDDVPSYRFNSAFHQKVIAAAQKAFPGLSVHLMDWNDRFDRLVVMTEGVEDPQTWWLVDIKTGKATDLGVSFPMAPEDVAPMRMIHYSAADGTDIGAVLTLPPQRPAKNLPVVVFPHGGPGARDYPRFDWWAQAFASRGYAVLQPNFRGSTGYGTSFERAGHGQWGRKMQTDISDGLARLIKDGIVDGKRACIMGASYGGYAALAGVTLQRGLYRCAVSVAGISDVQEMALTDISESGGNATMRRGLKEEVGSGANLRAVSPIRFVDQADAPILLIHGKDDTVVNYGQSKEMAEALRKAGKPVEFVTLPGEDHWLSKGTTRLAMLQAAMNFVEKHNPPDPDK